MKSTFLPLLILLVQSYAGATTIHMQLGNYAGTDKYGRACSVFLGAGFGQDYMSFYWYVNAEGSYRGGTLYDAQPTSPGKIEAGEPLMADGYDQGRPYFREFFGAPIGAYLIDSQYTMNIKGNVLKSFDFYVAPFGGTFGENSGCKRLKYTGSNRQL